MGGGGGGYGYFLEPHNNRFLKQIDQFNYLIKIQNFKIILLGTANLPLFALHCRFPLLDSEGNTGLIGNNRGWLTVYFDKVRIHNFSKIMQRKRNVRKQT